MGYISLGTNNKYYKYIIFYIISNLLYEATFGLNYGSLYTEIIVLEKQRNLRLHRLIYSIFYYFGIFLFSLILDKFDPNKKERESNRNDKSKIRLIAYKNENIKKQYNIIILVSFLWVVHEQLGIYYYYNYFKFSYLDYWTLEILIAYFISRKMFNIQIYKHQKFAIFFNSVLCSLFILIPFIILLVDEEIYNIKEKLILIPTGIISFLIIMFIRSYSNCKIKWISDYKDISVSKILIFYGLFGTIMCSLVSLFTTFVECNEYINCDIKKDGKKYFEHFSIFYENFSSSKIIFTFLIILNIIFGFLKSLFYLVIIKYLTPFHAIALPSIYYFLLIVILGFHTLINQKKKKEAKRIEIFFTICDIMADFFTIIGIFIYSEIIELNFCELNYNLKKNIIKRGNMDLYLLNYFKEGKKNKILYDDDDDDNDDEEDEENEKKNELSEFNNWK